MACRLVACRLVIILADAGILLIGPLGANFVDILIEFHTFENAFENVVSKMAAILSRPQCAFNSLFSTGYNRQ